MNEQEFPTTYGSFTTEPLTAQGAPDLSDWQCHLFGSTSIWTGITWRPAKGKEPNRFWRWMQYLAFGNRWVKVKS